MRISDWSSDVCSSDLAGIQAAKAAVPPARPTPRNKSRRSRLDKCILASSQSLVSRDYAPASLPPQNFLKPCARSIEPRLGGLLADPQNARGFGLAHAFDGAQHQRVLEGGRQFADRRHRAFEFALFGEVILEGNRWIGNVCRLLDRSRECEDPADRAASRPVTRLVDRDARDPQLEGATVVVARSEERRVGKECVSTCRSRWAP